MCTETVCVCVYVNHRVVCRSLQCEETIYILSPLYTHSIHKRLHIYTYTRLSNRLFNPFHPTGPFLAPIFMILINSLIIF